MSLSHHKKDVSVSMLCLDDLVEPPPPPPPPPEPSSFSTSRRQRPWYVVDPDAGWRRRWDLVSIAAVFVSVLAEPYVMAFAPNSSSGTALYREAGETDYAFIIVAMRLFWVAWFSLDVALSFATSFPGNDGEEVYDISKIAAHYAKGYLALDVFSTVPWEVACPANNRNRLLRLFAGLLPSLRAWRASTVGKARALYETMPATGMVHPILETLCRFGAWLLLLNHWFACGWFALGHGYRSRNLDDRCATSPPSQRQLRERCTWTQLRGYESSSIAYAYVSCFYWSLTTLATVGYGDITPNTIPEKAFACCCMLVGVVWFAGLVSSVENDIFTRDDDDEDNSSSKRRRSKKVLVKFMYDHKVPLKLSSEVQTYLRRHFEVEHAWCEPGVSRIVKQLPPRLLRALALHAYRKKLRAINFFDRKPWAFVVDCVVAMRSYAAGPGEPVVHAGTVLRSLHFVVRGACCVGGETTTTPFLLRSSGGTRVAVQRGGHFGEEGFLLNAVWLRPLVSRGWSELHIVPEPALNLERHPLVADELRVSAYSTVAKHDDLVAVVTTPPPPPPECMLRNPPREEEEEEEDDDDEVLSDVALLRSLEGDVARLASDVARLEGAVASSSLESRG
ncbi:hypothetical protein CTAYLR_007003 [Chrysophaeum taylorii]|uniref:Cyclic nucleotide-binding domain-containing protein n=1 Tax=Chrysophaeum taylorii TaxID=2483200 RepID=A0AAD7XJX1_9STRA|nr:hypothetical protein CTAYLR_007003 [Chrysophaeum taylorii]